MKPVHTSSTGVGEMSFLITHVRRGEGGAPEVLRSKRGDEPVAEVIRGIEDHERSYYTVWSGERGEVEIVEEAGATRLRSTPVGTDRNDLDNLPDF